MTKAVPYCSCKEGKLTRRLYHLRPTKVRVDNGLELCYYCSHTVVWMAENRNPFVTIEEEDDENDSTIQGYIKANQGLD